VNRILSVSSSRADIGALAPIWRVLTKSKGVELHVFLTGMHVPDDSAARAVVPPDAITHSGGADLGGGTPMTAAAAMGRIQSDAASLLVKIEPDLVLVMGDRLDMLPVATATLPFNLPLAHLHGGEVTEGAIDDRIRHALTKLAHVHCVSTPGARARLLAMGENEGAIHVTGAPGLDTLLATPGMSREEFCSAIGLPGTAPFRLVTVHPETNSPDPEAPLNAVLEALAERAGPTVFTAPNADPGGARMLARVEQFVRAHDWAILVDTLGLKLYPNALRHSSLMLGNSSSGIVEAGLFGLPVINVGNRQKGRERGDNVIDVDSRLDRVIAVLDRIGPEPKRFAAGTPYGSGGAALKIADVLLDLPPKPILLSKPLRIDIRG
jgi:UDP-hydrolysing UDP-N-acetyl-D-glucosamine 2-epimerase